MNNTAETKLHGMGGMKFDFTVVSTHTTFGTFPAVYAFVRMAADYLGNNVDEVCYVGQTDDLGNQQSDLRLWAKLERYFSHRICVLACPVEANRLMIVSHLLAYYRPIGNLEDDQQEQPQQLKLVS
jgi:hypothetical protein